MVFPRKTVLCFAPFEGPLVYSLGSVLVSALILRRMTRLPGALFSYDVKYTATRPGVDGEQRRGRREDVPGLRTDTDDDTTDACAKVSELSRKAIRIVKLLEVDQGLKALDRVPTSIPCGHLRREVRRCFPPGLNPEQELSIKTAMKVEGTPCKSCRKVMERKIFETWTNERLKEKSVDQADLSRFSRAFAANVKQNWNKNRVPYVPNGHATEAFERGDGGNWNSERFKCYPRLTLVFSSGKPRLVTLFSGYNVKVLTPLHHALYASIRGRNWLLVGSPTHERLCYLKQGCEGELWNSFDYELATDNIKTAYVKQAVEVLIDKGVGLTSEEVKCLRVVANLCFATDGSDAAQSGQPMGSPMSFPLLCLINKTVLDLALEDLLVKGEIGFREYTRHRCLINGDDLLTRSTSAGDLVEAVADRGKQVGLITNKEKTKQSRLEAEINSTTFREVEDGCSWSIVQQKKSNVSALWMGELVEDILGFAAESSVTYRGFSLVVRSNLARLCRQAVVASPCVPFSWSRRLAREPWIVRALTQLPSSRVPDIRNLFPVEAMPDGFVLNRVEVNRTITARVIRVRDSGGFDGLAQELKERKRMLESMKPYHAYSGLSQRQRTAMLKYVKKQRPEKEFVLSCLADRWRELEKERLTFGCTLALGRTSFITTNDGSCPSIWKHIVEELKGYKRITRGKSVCSGFNASLVLATHD